MKRFIRYLYEYEQGKRKRNVGFVKVEQDEAECTVHIHGKGLRLESGSNFQVYLFYTEENSCIGICQGEIGYMGPALNYRLRYTKADVGEPENYDKINGVLLENAGRHVFAALWEEKFIDIEHMRKWQGQSQGVKAEQTYGEEVEEIDRTQEDIPSLNCGEEPGNQREEVLTSDKKEPERRGEEISLSGEEEPERQREAISLSGEEVPGRTEEQEDMVSLKRGRETENTEEQTGQGQPEERTAEDILERMSGTDDDTDGIGTPVWKVTKIQRKDITMLPRCEWRLANNNFLLHGYYNYRHLVLLDNGTVLKLGVPGIYHEKEARAAEGFGFPEFINANETKLSLKPEECNKEELFGYWCRQVRRRSV